MKTAYLEVTYRHGKIFATYYHVPHEAALTSVRTERIEPGLIVDIAANGAPLGIEITVPSLLPLPLLNSALASMGCAPASLADIQPLLAA